jgi:hypothetical protein
MKEVIVIVLKITGDLLLQFTTPPWTGSDLTFGGENVNKTSTITLN